MESNGVFCEQGISKAVERNAYLSRLLVIRASRCPLGLFFNVCLVYTCTLCICHCLSGLGSSFFLPTIYTPYSVMYAMYT